MVAPTSTQFDIVICELQPMPLADVGTRLLCRRCRRWAIHHTNRELSDRTREARP